MRNPPYPNPCPASFLFSFPTTILGLLLCPRFSRWEGSGQAFCLSPQRWLLSFSRPSPWRKVSVISSPVSSLSHEQLVEVCGEAPESGYRCCVFGSQGSSALTVAHTQSLANVSWLSSFLLEWYLMSAIHAIHKWASVQVPSLLIICFISLYFRLLDCLVILMYVIKVMIL